MKSLMQKLWSDDSGIVALEYLLLATIVGLGLVVGLASLEDALNDELVELSNAILAIDQGYSVASQTSTIGGTGTVKGYKSGMRVFDAPGHESFFVNQDGTPVNVSAGPGQP